MSVEATIYSLDMVGGSGVKIHAYVGPVKIVKYPDVFDGRRYVPTRQVEPDQPALCGVSGGKLGQGMNFFEKFPFRLQRAETDPAFNHMLPHFCKRCVAIYRKRYAKP